MATFKVCVRKRRSDGLWPVYLRIIHNRHTGYINTGMLVDEHGLTSKGRVKDSFVLRRCMEMIEDYAARLNRRDVSSWDLHQVKAFLLGGKERRAESFSDYARGYIERMEAAGSENNAKVYRAAVNSLERHLGSGDVAFADVTREAVLAWIARLAGTRRARKTYPMCVRQIFREAVLSSQDPGSEIAPIAYDPFSRIEIPQPEAPRKKAMDVALCRRVFALEFAEGMKGRRKAEVSRDVALLSFCLGAINTVDLYKLRKSDLRGGILCYRRSKTSGRRADGAYMEMRVPPRAAALLEKYAAAEGSEMLLSFSARYSSARVFAVNVGQGMDVINGLLGLDGGERLTFYSFRHTWATIARNECGASLSEVGFAMNHLQHDAVTRGYVKPDFSPAWRLNEAVLDVVFGGSGKRPLAASKIAQGGPFVLSPAMLVRVAAFCGGRCVANFEDMGLGSREDVAAAVAAVLPEDAGDTLRVKVVDLGGSGVMALELRKGVDF